jgi:outer membrane protein assembly factor BamB
MRSKALLLFVLGVVVMAGPIHAVEDQWPQFRGPNGAGVGEGTGYPIEFSPSRNLAWKADVPFGQSSPVVVGNHLYVSAREGDQLVTIALNAGSGEQVWRRSLRRTRQMPMYKANDPASPTPAADANGVVAFFAEFGLVGYDRSGATTWTYPMGPFKNFYGMSSSPIIAGDLVIQLIDQLTGSYLVALDRRTGRERWRANRPGATIGYATPIVFRPSEGRTDLVTIGSTRLDAYDLATGAARWWMPIGSGGSMGVALAESDTLWLSTLASDEPGLPPWTESLAKFNKDGDSRISPAELAVAADLIEHFGWIDTSDDKFITEAEWNVARTLGMGAWGAIALKPGVAGGMLPADRVLWRVQRNVPYIPAPLLYQGVFYMVKTGGIITSINATTGAILKQGRAPSALGEYYASPVAADGKIFVASQEGKITVLKAGAEWDVLSVNDLHEEINATPALAAGRLYVRTRERIYCFSQPPPR